MPAERVPATVLLRLAFPPGTDHDAIHDALASLMVEAQQYGITELRRPTVYT